MECKGIKVSWSSWKTQEFKKYKPAYGGLFYNYGSVFNESDNWILHI